MLKINNLYYFNENKLILNDISFQITRNESLSILFEDEKTKKYFISILLGVIKEHAGSIYLNDIELNNIKPQNRRIGYISKNPYLREDLTVYDNIAYHLRKTHINEKIVENKVDKLIKDFNLEIISSVLVKDISYYQKLVVSLLRTITSDKELLILDDPLENIVDEKKEEYKTFIKKIYNYINKPVLIYLDKVNELTNKTLTISKEGKVLDFQRNNSIYKYPCFIETSKLLNTEYNKTFNKDKYLIEARIKDDTLLYGDIKNTLNKIFLNRFIDINDVCYMEIITSKITTIDTGNDIKFVVKKIEEDNELVILETEYFKIVRTNNNKYYEGMLLYYPIHETYFLNSNKEKINSIYSLKNNSIKIKGILKGIGMIRVFNNTVFLHSKIDIYKNNLILISNKIYEINNHHGMKIKNIISLENLGKYYVLGLRFNNDNNIYFVICNQIKNIYTNDNKYLSINMDNIKLI